MGKVTKLSTLTKRAMVNSPVAYMSLRDRTLQQIVNSSPQMNVRVVIATKPF